MSVQAYTRDEKQIGPSQVNLEIWHRRRQKYFRMPLGEDFLH